MRQPGMLALVLHAHLPFVRHPEQREFLEERWLFEAITESYLPLLERLQRLANDGVPYRLTMSFSPTLLTMLSDPLLQERYVRHIERLIELAEREIQRTRWLPPFQRLALFYHHRFTTARQLFVGTYRADVMGAFRDLSDRGFLEPMATCATHGFLPVIDPTTLQGGGMNGQAASARAQIRLGVQMCEEVFGKHPTGFWLPECGYVPGHDALLKAQGIRYFITDAHGILFGSPRPKHGIFAPAVCPSGVAAFGRDLESAHSVWGADHAYPSHPEYREFYRDIGFDLEYEYVRPYFHDDGTRLSTGIKYYRITGRTDEKQPYNPDRALEQAARHAAHFVLRRQQQAQSLRRTMGRAPVIVSPYDAELLGHWWFEGPDWLERVIQKMHAAAQTVRMVTLTDALEAFPSQQPLEPIMSSWGVGGYGETWLNSANDWIYRHLHLMADRMVEAATQHPDADPLRRRALNQMARELLLAQSSDWAFILKAQTHTAYAYRRLNDHLARFAVLYDSVMGGEIDEPSLTDIEANDRLFPSLDYRIYTGKGV